MEQQPSQPQERVDQFLDLPPHVRRMAIEKQQLDDRLNKLREFIDSNSAFQSLDSEDQRLLHSQRVAMTSYSEILTARLNRASK